MEKKRKKTGIPFYPMSGVRSGKTLKGKVSVAVSPHHPGQLPCVRGLKVSQQELIWSNHVPALLSATGTLLRMVDSQALILPTVAHYNHKWDLRCAGTMRQEIWKNDFRTASIPFALLSGHNSFPPPVLKHGLVYRSGKVKNHPLSFASYEDFSFVELSKYLT